MSNFIATTISLSVIASVKLSSKTKKRVKKLVNSRRINQAIARQQRRARQVKNARRCYLPVAKPVYTQQVVAQPKPTKVEVKYNPLGGVWERVARPTNRAVSARREAVAQDSPLTGIDTSVRDGLVNRHARAKARVQKLKARLASFVAAPLARPEAVKLAQQQLAEAERILNTLKQRLEEENAKLQQRIMSRARENCKVPMTMMMRPKWTIGQPWNADYEVAFNKLDRSLLDRFKELTGLSIEPYNKHSFIWLFEIYFKNSLEDLRSYDDLCKEDVRADLLVNYGVEYGEEAVSIYEELISQLISFLLSKGRGIDTLTKYVDLLPEGSVVCARLRHTDAAQKELGLEQKNIVIAAVPVQYDAACRTFDRSNRNFHINMDAAHADKFLALHPDGVDSTFLGFNKKRVKGERITSIAQVVDEYNSSPIGIEVGKVHIKPGSPSFMGVQETLHELPAGYPRHEVQVQYINLDLFNNRFVHDTSFKQLTNEAKQLRVMIREALINGVSADDAETLIDYGTDLQVFHSLHDVLTSATPVSIPEVMPGRHYMFVIGSVVELGVFPPRTKFSNNTDEHTRLFCNDMLFVYVPADKVDGLFKSNLELKKPYKVFTFSMKGDKPVAAKPVAPAATKRTFAPAPMPAPVALMQPTPAPKVGNILEELRAYHRAMKVGATTTRAPQVPTVEECVLTANSLKARGKYDAVLDRKVGADESGALIADAVRYYIWLHAERSGFAAKHQINSKRLSDFCAEYSWSKQDVFDMVDIIRGVCSMLKLSHIVERDGDYIYIGENKDYHFHLNGDLVFNDRGQMFHNMFMVKEVPVLDSKGKKTSKKTKELVSLTSMSAFVLSIYAGLLPLIAQWQRNSVSNTAVNYIKFIDECDWFFKLTEHDFASTNGARKYGVIGTYHIVDYIDFKPFGKDGKWCKLSGEGADGLLSFYKLDGKDDEKSLDIDNVLGLQQAALDKFSLGFHHAKKKFMAGHLTHIDLRLLRQHAPSIYSMLRTELGDVIDGKDVIALSDKFEKGAKRITLALAEGAPVQDAKPEGSRLFNQTETTEGMLVRGCIAPSLVGQPGLIYWVGGDNKHTAIPVRTYKMGYTEFDENNPIDLDSVASKLTIHNTTQTIEHGWTVLTPTVKIEVPLNKSLLRYRLKSGITKPVVYEGSDYGTVTRVRYQVIDSMSAQKQKVLNVEIDVQSPETDGKIRSFAKGMEITVDGRIIHNEMNRGKLEVDRIYPQDACKLDYIGWILKVIGTTVKYSGDKPKMAKVMAEYNKLKAELEFSDVMLADEALLLAGVYDRLIEEFLAVFARPIWFHHEQVGDQGEIIKLYQNCVAEGKGGWHEVDWDCDFACADGDTKDDYTNVFRFWLDENGKVKSYDQRCWTLVGTDDCPLWNVDIFESSTVKEAVGDSVQMAANIFAMSFIAKNPGSFRAEQLRQIDNSTASILKTKYLATAYEGGVLSEDMYQVILETTITENLKLPDAFFNSEVYARLTQDDLRLLADERVENTKKLELLTGVFSDVQFYCKDSSGKERMLGWLPALCSMNKLRSTSESNHSLCPKVFNIILNCILQQPVKAIQARQAIGMMKSLLKSRNTKKFINGSRVNTAKTIGNPCVPVDQVWVEYSERPDSLYADLVRMYGHKLIAQAYHNNVILIYGTRAPMPGGFIAWLRIKDPQDMKKMFWRGGINVFQLNPMQCLIDAGDHDGDGRAKNRLDITVENVSEIADLEHLYKIRCEAMGIKDLFATSNDQYVGDWGRAKHWSKLEGFFYPAALKKRISKKAVKSSKDYVFTNMAATELQNKGVGKAYDAYMIPLMLCEMAQVIQDKMPASLPSVYGDLVVEYGRNTLPLAMSEVYEVILGAYSIPSYKFWKEYCEPIIDGGDRKFDLSTDNDYLNNFREVLSGMSANSAEYRRIAAAMNAASDVLSIERDGAAYASINYDEYEDGSRRYYDVKTGETVDSTVLTENFMRAAALVGFELTRGRFRGFAGLIDRAPTEKDTAGQGHKSALGVVYKVWRAVNGDENYAGVVPHTGLDIDRLRELFDPHTGSLVLASLAIVFENLGTELVDAKLTGFTEAQLKHFTDKVKVREEEVAMPDVPVAPTLPLPVTSAISLPTVQTETEAAPTTSVLPVVDIKEMVLSRVNDLTPEQLAKLLPVLDQIQNDDNTDDGDDEDGGLPLPQPPTPPLPSGGGFENIDYDVFDFIKEEDVVVVDSPGLPVASNQPPLPTLPLVFTSEPVQQSKVHKDVKQAYKNMVQSFVKDEVKPAVVNSNGLTSDQQEVVDEILSGKNVLVLGPAGTGKSYILTYLKEVWQKQGVEFRVTALTGKATMNIGGDGTFHSKFGLRTSFTETSEERGMLDGDGLQFLIDRALGDPKVIEFLTHREHTILASEDKVVVWVDEVSQGDVRDFIAATNTAKEVGVKVQWVFSGDFFQMCSPDGDEYFLFNSWEFSYADGHKMLVPSPLDTEQFSKMIITQNMRQKGDPAFAHELNMMAGWNPEGIGISLKDLPIMMQRWAASDNIPENAMHIYFNRKCVQEHNEKELAKLRAAGKESRVYKARVNGLSIPFRDRQKWINDFLPVEEVMTLYMDCRVRITNNIYENKDGRTKLVAANGSFGTITHLGDDFVKVKLDQTGREVFINMTNLELRRDMSGNPLGIFEQLPLHPAYAATPYGMQGTTCDHPIVVHGYSMYRYRNGGVKVLPVEDKYKGLLYNCCSRVTKAEYLYFDKTGGGRLPAPVALSYLCKSLHQSERAIQFVHRLMQEQGKSVQ